MALLSVSRLVCGAWSLEKNVVLTLSLLTHLIVNCVDVSLGCSLTLQPLFPLLHNRGEIRSGDFHQVLMGMPNLGRANQIVQQPISYVYGLHEALSEARRGDLELCTQD